MKVKLSEADRALIALAQRQVPWQGVEAVMLARYELGRALKLDELEKATKDKELAQLSTAPTFTVDLKREAVELLIVLVAGGGQPIKGEIAPMLAELVGRIRRAAPVPAKGVESP